MIAWVRALVVRMVYAQARALDSLARRLSRWTVVCRLVHWGPWLIIALALIYVPAEFAAQSDSWWAAIPSGVVVVCDALLLLVGGAHNGVLCTICAELTPLDGQAAAAKANRWLLIYHNRHKAYRALSLIVAVAGLSLLGAAVVSRSLLPSLALSNLLLIASMAVPIRVWLVHKILYPWCPYCRRRWKDGGDHEKVPDPMPSNELNPA